MADAVTSQTIVDGEKTVVQKFTNISDGTGESAVVKVDVSALAASQLGKTCTGVTIEKIWWQCIGMKTRLFFDATSDAFIIELGENQSGYHDSVGLVGYQTTLDQVRQVMSYLQLWVILLETLTQ